MKVVYVSDSRYLEYEGELYSERMDYNTTWKRYFTVFDEIVIVGRTKKVNTQPENMARATGPKVCFVPLPSYTQMEYFKVRPIIKNTIKNIIAENEAFVLRTPAAISALVGNELIKQQKKFIVEIGGDPWEVGKYLPMPLPLRLVYQLIGKKHLKSLASNAIGVLYVTQEYLQKKYPCSKNAVSVSASNVFIPLKNILTDISKRTTQINSVVNRLTDFNAPRVRLGAIGWLYSIKSPLEIVSVIHKCVSKGFNLEMHFVGGGPLENKISKLAAKLSISDRIILRGKISSGQEIFDFIDTMDLYVQFSKSEGLPRSVIESMARGCPVIASNVGGTYELLPSDLLVHPMDVDGLALLIQKLLQTPERLKKAVTENIAMATNFSAEKLSVKRKDFYVEIYRKHFS